MHPYWGEALFIQLIWPEVPILAYAEWYADLNGGIWDFDPELPAPMDRRCLAQAGNAATAISYAEATSLQTPTRFQWESLPPAFRERADILYDGIRTEEFRPDPAAVLTLEPDGKRFSGENPPPPNWFPRRREALTLTRADTVVTFINRVLEP